MSFRFPISPNLSVTAQPIARLIRADLPQSGRHAAVVERDPVFLAVDLAQATAELLHEQVRLVFSEFRAWFAESTNALKSLK